MKVRELLSDESKWVKGCLAQTSDGRTHKPDGLAIPADDPDAIRWGLMGAIEKCYPGLLMKEPINKIIQKLGPALPNLDGKPIEVWRDEESTPPDEEVDILLLDALHGNIGAWEDESGRTFAEIKALVDELDI